MATQEVAQPVPDRFQRLAMLCQGYRLDDIGAAKIYFLAGAGLIKIGVTTDVDKRIRSLENSSPVLLEFLGCYPGTRSDERALHDRFKHLRRHGEWFDDCAELIAYIESVVADGWHRRKAA